GDATTTAGRGAGALCGNTGSDTFIWNPGDGSDVIEGGSDESDVLLFNGAAAAETFTRSPGATSNTRLLLTRDIGGISMDVAGVEQVNVNGLGGGDTFTVN